MRCIVAALVLVFAATVSNAEQLIVKRSATAQPYILFVGGVVSGSGARLEKMLSDNPDINTVSFYSGGGLAGEGYIIGQVLSDNSSTAVVESGHYCLSACAMGFIGAARYEIRGVLGFHSPYLAPGDITPKDEVMKNAQGIGAWFMTYTMLNGFSAQMYWTIQNRSNPQVFLVFTNLDDLMDYYVRDDDGVDAYSNYHQSVHHGDEWVDMRMWFGSAIGWYVYRQQMENLRRGV